MTIMNSLIQTSDRKSKGRASNGASGMASLTLESRLRKIVVVLCLTAMVSPLKAEDQTELNKVSTFQRMSCPDAVFPKTQYSLLMKNAGIVPGSNYYLHNQWRKRKGDSRAGHVMTFSGQDIKIMAPTAENVVPWKLQSTGQGNRYNMINQWRANSGGDKRVDYHLSFSSEMAKLYPDTDKDLVPWEFQRVSETEDQFYIINRWKESANESRAGMALSFSGNDVKLYPSSSKSDWAPWQLIPIEPVSGSYGVECHLYSNVVEIDRIVFKMETPQSIQVTRTVEKLSGFTESMQKTNIFENEITESKETENSKTMNMEAAYGAITVGIEASNKTTTTNGQRQLNRSELSDGLVMSSMKTETETITIEPNTTPTYLQVVIKATVYRAWSLKGEKKPFLIEDQDVFVNYTNIRR
jgi:hypothetical protein